ncbi:hypothetical protein WFP10_12650 [Yersinia enterocolitica]
MKEEQNIVFEHAWKYFELHSQQRMTVFNFYIAVIGLLATGYGVCIQIGGGFIYLTPALGLFITFITFIFYKLDQRVSFLIKNSESVLKAFEQGLQKPDLKIFTRDDVVLLNKNIFSMWTYGKCFRITFYILANIGIALTSIPFFILLFK